MPGLLEQLMKLRLGKRAGVLLDDDVLALDGLEFCQLLCQLRPRGEDGRALRGLVQDVDYGGLGGTVLLEEGGNHLARLLDVGDGELALGILILGVDDDKGAVGGRGSRRRHANDGSEGLSRGHGCGCWDSSVTGQLGEMEETETSDMALEDRGVCDRGYKQVGDCQTRRALIHAATRNAESRQKETGVSLVGSWPESHGSPSWLRIRSTLYSVRCSSCGSYPSKNEKPEDVKDIDTAKNQGSVGLTLDLVLESLGAGHASRIIGHQLRHQISLTSMLHGLTLGIPAFSEKNKNSHNGGLT